MVGLLQVEFESIFMVFPPLALVFSPATTLFEKTQACILKGDCADLLSRLEPEPGGPWVQILTLSLSPW